jgi:hypothetical protein
MLHERTKMSLSELFEWSISGSQSGNQRVPKLFSRLALSIHIPIFLDLRNRLTGHRS